MVNDDGEAKAGVESRAPARVDAAALAVSVEGSISAALRSRPGLVSKLVDVIESGLVAEKWTFDLVKKQKVFEPDHRIRLDTAKLALAYLEGLPVQTVVGASVGDAGAPRLAEVLKRSPNARRVLEGFVSRLGPIVEADQNPPVESAPSAPSGGAGSGA